MKMMDALPLGHTCANYAIVRSGQLQHLLPDVGQDELICDWGHLMQGRLRLV